MPGTTQTAWPEDVLARYLTVGGSTVDIGEVVTEVRDAPPPYPGGIASQVGGQGYRSTCTGCGANDIDGEFVSRFDSWGRARRWAQSHAEKCRAMPRPTA